MCLRLRGKATRFFFLGDPLGVVNSMSKIEMSEGGTATSPAAEIDTVALLPRRRVFRNASHATAVTTAVLALAGCSLFLLTATAPLTDREPEYV